MVATLVGLNGEWDRGWRTRAFVSSPRVLAGCAGCWLREGASQAVEAAAERECKATRAEVLQGHAIKLTQRRGSEPGGEMELYQGFQCIICRGLNNYRWAEVESAVITRLLPVFLSRNAEAPKLGFRVSANQRSPIFRSQCPKPQKLSMGAAAQVMPSI